MCWCGGQFYYLYINEVGLEEDKKIIQLIKKASWWRPSSLTPIQRNVNKEKGKKES